MPTRIEFTPGGEFLIPYAKRELKALTKRAQDMGLSALSKRTLIDPEGHIDYQYNKFGIDTIKIQWGGELPHGFVTWPASDDAEYGWGDPFKDENDVAINPPLGTVLTEDTEFKRREVLLRPKDGKYKLKRRITIKQEPEPRRSPHRGSDVWFSKDRKIVLSANISKNSRLQPDIAKMYIYSLGYKIASFHVKESNIPGENAGNPLIHPALMAFGAFTEEALGVKKKYLWIVVKSIIPGVGSVLWSYKTERLKKCKRVVDPLSTDSDGKKFYTEWEKIGEQILVGNAAFFLNGKYNNEIAFAGVGANESCSEAAIIYCDNSARDIVFTTGLVSIRTIICKETDIPSGHIVVTRSPFLVQVLPNNRTLGVPPGLLGGSSATLGNQEGFVFDAGYRADTLVLARLVTDYINVENNTVSPSPHPDFLSAPKYYGVSTEYIPELTNSYRSRVVCGEMEFVHRRGEVHERGYSFYENRNPGGGLYGEHTSSGEIDVESTHILYFDVARKFALLRTDKFKATYSTFFYAGTGPGFVPNEDNTAPSHSSIAITEYSTKYKVIVDGAETYLGVPENDDGLFSVFRARLTARQQRIMTPGMVTWPFVSGLHSPLTPFGIDAVHIGSDENSAAFSNQTVMLFPYYKFQYDLRLDHRYKSQIVGNNYVWSYQYGSAGNISLDGLYTFDVNVAHFLTDGNKILTFYSIPYTKYRPTNSPSDGYETTEDVFYSRDINGRPPHGYNPIINTAGAHQDLRQAVLGGQWLINPSGGWGEKPENIKYANFLTGDDPVTLTETTGPRPRFNDIGVI